MLSPVFKRKRGIQTVKEPCHFAGILSHNSFDYRPKMGYYMIEIMSTRREVHGTDLPHLSFAPGV